MSTLTRLSAARMQLAEVLATECARCGHPLEKHSISMRVEGTPCRHWDLIPDPKGYKHGNGKTVYCRCKEWRDPAEQLDLKVKK